MASRPAGQTERTGGPYRRGERKWVAAACAAAILLACLSAPGGAVRIKVPKSVCGRIPNTYECDAIPVGVVFKGQPPPASQEWEDKDLDNGRGRAPTKCTPGVFCPYGQTTYAFGRNQYSQLGLGDRKTRNLPTVMPTAYAKINQLASGDHSNILRWEGRNELYSWGRDDFGQLGHGPSLNDTLPNRIFMGRPVLLEMGGQHSLISIPPAPANMFDYDDFAGKKEEFVHYGDSSQPVGPADLCPICIPWENTPTPQGIEQKYKGRECQNPPWSEANGVKIVGLWCFVQKDGNQPCLVAQQITLPGRPMHWIVGCKDLAKFSLTPDPPERLKVGAVWRKDRVQIYQAWRMSVFFKIRKSDSRTFGGNGLTFAIQNNGINPEDNPIGGTGRDLGLARSTRYSFSSGIPNSFAIEIRTIDNDGALEIRGCYGRPYTADNSLPENARCQIGISYWKPERLCNPLDPDTCCTDTEIREVNKCFKEDLKDGAPHQMTIIYSPFSMEVFLDDPRIPKIRVDVDIREHVRSYKCEDGPNKDKNCHCDGSTVCGGVEDTEACMEYNCIISGMAWVGFTSATGDSFSVHEVESWSFFNLGQDGGLVTFGRNIYGQLGLGDKRHRAIGNLVVDLDGLVVQRLAAGRTHSIALTTRGDVYTWGGNHFGQLGQGDLSDRIDPTKVRVLESMRTAAEMGDACVCTRIIAGCRNLPPVAPCTFQVVAVSAGAYHSLAVVKRDNGAHEIWGWGDNQFGQLGCLVLPPNGVVECPWNLKSPGTLGNWPNAEALNEPCSGTNIRCMSTPRKLAAFDQFGRQAMSMNFHSLQSGAYHNVLITRECPKCPMPSLCKNQAVDRDDCDCDAGARIRTNVKSLWMQESADCIAKDLEVYTWGGNLRGQLGNNCSNNAHHEYQKLSPHRQVCPDSPIPIRLNSPRDIHLLPYYPDIFPYRANPSNPKRPIMTIKPETVVIGGYHNLLIFDDKSIVVWGSNYFGQLGLGDFRRRIYPVPLDYFRTKLVPAPNLSPRDGAGESKKTIPEPILSQQRSIHVASAGEHHTIVTVQCQGAGFKTDGSCDCRFGWKGVDCNIQCNGGANNSCSGRGTFDSSNRRGDRESCRAYLAKKTEDGLYDNDGKCVGLKTGPLNPNVGCPGSIASEGCPTACQFCDEELYDCENDGSCICKQGFTGPDCAFHCVPLEPKYNFMKVAGGALCECQSCWEGMYCHIYTCPNDTSTDRELTDDEKAALEYKKNIEEQSSAASYGDTQWWLLMALVLLASSLISSIGTGR